MLKIPRDQCDSRLNKNDIAQLRQNSSKCNSKATLLLAKLHKLEKKIAARMKANEKEIVSKDPAKYIVKAEGKSLHKKHKKELRRAQ
jgi:hypothetical protein